MHSLVTLDPRPYCASQNYCVAFCLDDDSASVYHRTAFQCCLDRAFHFSLADLRLDLNLIRYSLDSQEIPHSLFGSLFLKLPVQCAFQGDRSEEHTSELQS